MAAPPRRWSGCGDVHRLAAGPAGGAGEPVGDIDDLRADRAGVGLRVEGRGEGASGAGEVECHRREHKPGRVRGEAAEAEVGDGYGSEVGVDLFDDRVPAVLRFGLQHDQG